MEFVLVVRREHLFPDCFPQGFHLDGEVPAGEYLDRARQRSFFIERRAAETDPGLKQIIPYCLVIRPAGREIFVMRRLQTQGEARLHGKRSVGVGGHINPVDLEPGEDVIEKGRERELAEEVELSGVERRVLLGILNDDGNPVGAVHFGLVFGLVLAPGGQARVREAHAMEGAFQPLEEALEVCKNLGIFESWSEAVLRRAFDWQARLLS